MQVYASYMGYHRNRRQFWCWYKHLSLLVLILMVVVILCNLREFLFILSYYHHRACIIQLVKTYTHAGYSNLSPLRPKFTRKLSKTPFQGSIKSENAWKSSLCRQSFQNMIKMAKSPPKCPNQICGLVSKMIFEGFGIRKCTPTLGRSFPSFCTCIKIRQ